MNEFGGELPCDFEILTSFRGLREPDDGRGLWGGADQPRERHRARRVEDNARLCAAIARDSHPLRCSASFRPTDENTRAMRDFFAAIDRRSRMRFLWEPRGPWPDELVTSLCRELALVHTVDPFLHPSLLPS